MNLAHPFGRLKSSAFAVTIALAAFVLAAGVAMATYDEQLYSAQHQRAVSEQAQVLAASASAAVFFGDRQATQEYVNALGVNPEIEAAGAYDSQGRLLAQFYRATTVKLPGLSAGLPLGRHDDYLNIAAPVMQNKSLVGTVYLRADTEPVQREIARYAGIVLLVIMGALVLAVIGMSQAALARANKELARRAQNLSTVNARLYIEMEERRKTEAALRQSQKMEAVGQLSGGIAHDFNNLLTIVKCNLQLLRRRIAQGKTGITHYIDSAEEGLTRASNLTQRILAFSRQQPLSPQPVHLNGLIDGMKDLIRQSIGETVELQTRLEAGWRTLCDANQMENVILNLAINARDAMPQGGLLAVETRDIGRADRPDIEEFIPGDYVELVLRDSGTGMSEEVQRRAVDPFFTTKPLGQGTGLGLSMAFGYIHQSGGYLKIESEVGKGTAIVILMPRHVGAEQRPGE